MVILFFDLDVFIAILGILGGIMSFAITPYFYSNQGIKYPALLFILVTGIPALISVATTVLLLKSDFFIERNHILSRIERYMPSLKEVLIVNYTIYSAKIPLLICAYFTFTDSQITQAINVISYYYLSKSVVFGIKSILIFFGLLFIIKVILSILKGELVSSVMTF